jgi:hypothetical protein
LLLLLLKRRRLMWLLLRLLLYLVLLLMLLLHDVRQLWDGAWVARHGGHRQAGRREGRERAARL